MMKQYFLGPRGCGLQGATCTEHAGPRTEARVAKIWWGGQACSHAPAGLARPSSAPPGLSYRRGHLDESAQRNPGGRGTIGCRAGHPQSPGASACMRGHSPSGVWAFSSSILQIIRPVLSFCQAPFNHQTRFPLLVTVHRLRNITDKLELKRTHPQNSFPLFFCISAYTSCDPQMDKIKST